MAEKKQAWVEITITRGVGFKGESKRPGDKVSVPETFEVDGVPPVRWWEATRKGYLNPVEAAEVVEELAAAGVIQVPEKKVAKG